MIRAFWKLQQVNTGFDPAGVVSFSLNLPTTKYKSPERLQFVDSLEQKLKTLPRCRRCFPGNWITAFASHQC
jgi:hypothetical protein